MNRLSFLKKLAIGVVTIVVAPKILAEIKKKESHIISVSRTMTNHGATSVIYYDGSIIKQMYPYLQEQHFFWLRMQTAINKTML